MENKFYVYALLDPRKPGEFKYEEFIFDHEPFYIGKGCRNRILVHSQKQDLNRSYNQYKKSKINHIIEAGLKPIGIKILDKLSEQDAFDLEIKAISNIGMKNTGGPLTNLHEGGKGHSCLPETRQKLSKIKKEMYANGEIALVWLGKKHSEESKIKMSENSCKARKWKLVSPEGKTFIVDGKRMGFFVFCDQYKLSRCHLVSVATGKRKSHKGWTCSYYND